jgi:hypothetical protein
MDVYYDLHGQGFEWDLEKAAANFRKHHVSFEKACEVFFDPFVKVTESMSEEGEMRDAAIGLTEDWTLLIVIDLLRRESFLRLISARPATPSERREYEHENE